MSKKYKDTFSELITKAMQYIESGKRDIINSNKTAYEKLSDYMTDIEIESSHAALSALEKK